MCAKESLLSKLLSFCNQKFNLLFWTSLLQSALMSLFGIWHNLFKCITPEALFTESDLHKKFIYPHKHEERALIFIKTYVSGVIILRRVQLTPFRI